MTQYSFLTLAPDEFEFLCRDLLQDILKLEFESFKPGPDGGIDLRAWVDNDEQVIAQCKRYGDLDNLTRDLKKEVPKVKALNPSRYYLCTSLGLSPKNKKAIADLFDGKLLEKNIFGNQDLNKFIGLCPEVERRHYKLWLSSIEILQAIINNKIHIQSQNEQQQLERISQIYVMNNSFDEALTLVRRNKFVVLSGSPGVGKTTLARVLAYEFIKNNFRLVVATNSIKEAWDAFAESEDQVILFDDFLGRNILEGRYPINEEHQLVNFIEKVVRSKNKVLILTTREYILNQAKTKYEIIKSAEIDISKCIVDVSNYTKYIKAKILYNHLFFADLPDEYIKEIIESKVYLTITNHDNYNPRIIEAIVKKRDWTKLDPSEFCQKLIEYFDKPYTIWESAYEEEINNLSRILLLILLTTGTPVLRDDLYQALDSFSKSLGNKYDFKLNDINFSRSIRELHDTFIVTNLDSYGSLGIDFQNPSIYDFLVDYLDKRDNLQIDLLANACYFHQLFEVFTTPSKTREVKGNWYNKGRVAVSDKVLQVLKIKLLSNFEHLSGSKAHIVQMRDGRNFWKKDEIGVYEKLAIIVRNYFDKDREIKTFVESTFRNNSIPKDFKGWEHSSYVYVLEKYHLSVLATPKSMMAAFAEQVYWAQQLTALSTFKKLYPQEFKEFIDNDKGFKTVLKYVVKNEIDSANADNTENIIDEIQELSEHYNYNVDHELEALRKIQEANIQDDDDTVEGAQVYSGQAEEIDDDDLGNEHAIQKLFSSLAH